MISRLLIYLEEDERKALQSLALSEMRGLKEQIRFVIHEDLSRRGLLPRAKMNFPASQLAADLAKALSHD